jgi:hypothetical protein
MAFSMASFEAKCGTSELNYLEDRKIRNVLEPVSPGQAVCDQALHQLVWYKSVDEEKLVDSVHGLLDGNRVEQIAQGNIHALRQLACFRPFAHESPNVGAALHQFLHYRGTNGSRGSCN